MYQIINQMFNLAMSVENNVLVDHRDEYRNFQVLFVNLQTFGCIKPLNWFEIELCFGFRNDVILSCLEVLINLDWFDTGLDVGIKFCWEMVCLLDQDVGSLV